jgi:restriction system protein
MANPIRCPFCRHDVPAGRVTCPYCANRLPEDIRRQVVASREAERARGAALRAAAQQQAQAAMAEVERMNEMLDTHVLTLETLLAQTLAVDNHLEFEGLKDNADFPRFDPGPLGVSAPKPWVESLPPPELPPRPSLLGRLVPGWSKRYAEQIEVATASHEASVKSAEAANAAALAAYEDRERERKRKLAIAHAKHERAAKQFQIDVDAQHRRVDEFRQEFEAGELEAVCAYFDLVLRRSSYPDNFPKKRRLAYVPLSRQLVVEYELPPFKAVPSVASYKYIKSRNSVTESAGL